MSFGISFLDMCLIQREAQLGGLQVPKELIWISWAPPCLPGRLVGLSVSASSILRQNQQEPVTSRGWASALRPGLLPVPTPIPIPSFPQGSQA